MIRRNGLNSSMASSEGKRGKRIKMGGENMGKKLIGQVPSDDNDDHQAKDESDELHTWTERERRKKMKTMFTTLHSLLPNLDHKADKSSIVDEAVKYIKTLEVTLQKLENFKIEKFLNKGMIGKNNSRINREAFVAGHCGSSSAISPENGLDSNIPQKKAIGFRSFASENVALNICGDVAHISVCSPKKPALFTAICYVLEKHKLEIVTAQISSTHDRAIFMIQLHAKKDIQHEALDEAFTVDEIYTRAAAEIMFWVNNYK